MCRQWRWLKQDKVDDFGSYISDETEEFVDDAMVLCTLIGSELLSCFSETRLMLTLG